LPEGRRPRLSESEFYTPDDLDLLRMENELLTFEIRFLKARLGSSGSGPGSSSTSLNQLARLEEAERDLVLLLRRIDTSPLGVAARLRINFQVLRSHYLESNTGDLAYSNRLAYLEQAEKDLVLVLRRLGRGLLGVLFRRRKSFRTLEQRYL